GVQTCALPIYPVDGRGDQRAHRRPRARRPLRRRRAAAARRGGGHRRGGREGPGGRPRRVGGVPGAGGARARGVGRLLPGGPGGHRVTSRPCGIRHHGPGSARALDGELAAVLPDIVRIEGPPEADAVVATAADPRLEPPVALLAYAVDDVSRAAFWPFAAFSPEWRAIRYAVDACVPV